MIAGSDGPLTGLPVIAGRSMCERPCSSASRGPVLTLFASSPSVPYGKVPIVPTMIPNGNHGARIPLRMQRG